MFPPLVHNPHHQMLPPLQIVLPPMVIPDHAVGVNGKPSFPQQHQHLYQMHQGQQQETKQVTQKRRRKKECPQCHKLFSNLTTHRAIHDEGPKAYICSTCQRGFKRTNDLIRHEKCHLSKLGQWQFHCPFHNDRVNSCHASGRFTRCDTYKNHLKAIHFKYPPNTQKAQRAHVPGNCKACGQAFPSVAIWLSNHVKNNSCPSFS